MAERQQHIQYGCCSVPQLLEWPLHCGWYMLMLHGLAAPETPVSLELAWQILMPQTACRLHLASLAALAVWEIRICRASSLNRAFLLLPHHAGVLTRGWKFGISPLDPTWIDDRIVCKGAKLVID